MQVIGVVGPSDAGKTTLVERLVDRLAERGRVGTVKHLDCEPAIDTEGKDTARHRGAGAVRTHGIADEGWFATGEHRTLTDALDDLAVDCDYAIVEGFSDARLPRVALGEERAAGPDDASGGSGADGDVPGQRGAPEVVLAAPTADDVDLDAAVEAVESVEPHETLASLVARAKASPAAERAGAIATFTGRVRRRDGPEDPPTEHLAFERYDEVAAERTAAIREELAARDGVYEVLLHHRTGVVEAGEDIVFVVVLAGHRAEAFATVEDGIDRLKEEVPLFKKEVTVEGEFWAHEHDH